MSDIGNTSADLTPASPARRPPFLAILLLVAVVALAFFIGTNVLSVLYAIIAPPLPPLPPNMEQVSHESPAYGVDNWKYSTTQDACELVKYVQDNGGVCVVAPMTCGEFRDEGSGNSSLALVARCSGDMAFSIFNEQWWSLIMRQASGTASFELRREVFWIGIGPQ